MKNLNLICICGAHWSGIWLPKEPAKAIETIWKDSHSGDGHAPCDPETARRNRRKFEAQEAEEAEEEKGKP